MLLIHPTKKALILGNDILGNAGQLGHAVVERTTGIAGRRRAGKSGQIFVQRKFFGVLNPLLVEGIFPLQLGSGQRRQFERRSECEIVGSEDEPPFDQRRQHDDAGNQDALILPQAGGDFCRTQPAIALAENIFRRGGASVVGNIKRDRLGKALGIRAHAVKLFGIIALFILVIACVNFMNLTTARFMKRAKEIGIRKVAGAVRLSLIKQFIGEAILIAFFSLTIALAIVLLLLPAFNALTQKHISLPVANPSFWLIILTLALVTGLVAGSYPAIFLSSFDPIKVLKGSIKAGPRAAFFRKALVVFQFTLSIVLIIGTIVVSQQINYIQTKNLGYDKNNVISIPLQGNLLNKYTTFKEEAVNIPGVQVVTRISQIPTKLTSGTSDVDWQNKNPDEKNLFVWAAVGYDFVKTLDLQLLEGRDFSKDYPTDSSGYLLNESALKVINYKNPVGKQFTFWGKQGTIIGIVKDFHFNSLHDPIQPLILRMREAESSGNALVRIEPTKTQQALRSLGALSGQFNPKFPFTYQFLDEAYSSLYTSEQMINKLSGYFAIIAIFICCLGLLGLVMFTAEQRIKEIGIRKVLGAKTASIFGLLSKDFLVLVFIAFIIASPLAWWSANNWLTGFAYRITISWWMFLLAGFLAMVIALVTISVQALKAAMANPLKSLRTE